MKIISKESFELSVPEIEAMEALIQEIDPGRPINYLQNNYLGRSDIRYYLCYEGSQLVGMTAFTTLRTLTPFHPQPIYVFRGFLTYRRTDANIRELTSRTSIMHMKHHLGRLWMFRTFAALAYSPNPRVYVQFRRFFPLIYPEVGQEAPQTIRKFLEIILPYGERLDPFLVSSGNFGDHFEISGDYALKYRTRDSQLNEFYQRNRIFRKDEERIFLTGRQQQIIGVWRPWKGIRHIISQLTGKRK